MNKYGACWTVGNLPPPQDFAPKASVILSF